MIELKVLFWNLGGNTRNKNYKPGIEAIKELTERDSFDVILLAECNEQARLNIYSELNKISSTYVNGSTIGSKLAVFHKLSQNQKPIQVFHSQRYSFFHYMDTLVVGVHLQSRYPNLNGVNLYKKAAEVKTEIVEIADKYSTQNIIIVGDFNLDPFEHGMTAMDGFNASFSPIVAKRRPVLRLYAKKYLFKHPYFFNPSWHLHGHFGNKVQGTYYKTDSE